MPEPVVRPLLRWFGEDTAPVWVETRAAREVGVLGTTTATFCVAGHHFGLVALSGLEPGTTREDDVRLDGQVRWPEPGSRFPPSTICTIDPGRPLELVFGSCRVAVPHDAPHCLAKDDHDEGREVDALFALAHRMRQSPPAEWPDALLMLGDQIYADEDAPATRAFIRSRRDTSRPPYEGVLDFEEYCHLYRE